MVGRSLALGAVAVLFVLGACSASGGQGSPAPPVPTTGELTGLVFAYGVGGRNVLDTSRGTFTKDMVTAPPVTISLRLDEGELLIISRKMAEIGFFALPTVFTPLVAADGGQVEPFVTYRFEVRTPDGCKVVRWDDKFVTDDDRAARLRSLARLIERIIVAKPAYRQLPEAEGGYL